MRDYTQELGPARLARLKEVVSRRRRDIIVVLEGIHDPHNAEAIFRTCDAFGVQEAWLVFGKEKPWNPKSIGKSSSSAANKWLDFKSLSIEKAVAELKAKGYRVYATALTQGAKPLGETRFSGKAALLLGNEHEGLSKKALGLADEIVMLPMLGMVQSLNVSVTAAIFLHEMCRQMPAKPLPKKEQQALLKDFAKRARG